ncbi:pentapeptide repeat-containing protein [Limnofasciculus baicalensis]|uniref:Pentapeptide repeat-containing protein n=1 Tax=Limnofasciculus baicalensis BBK-W-15 TaxID=2699891 RepID=A0AAE3GRF3_9CYAN|nr:pentapeptide repeat-containing protein [Limnofasciculus baicalensis]MCP2728592.1 pentapeptide repeat-containing protein [Limnofasciculus baicalensis BBK-W-15]
MIKLKNLLAAAIVSTLGFATPTQAGNPEDVKRLLETKECTGCDLKNADLRGVDLSLAILVDANLSGANLSGANLSQADLSRANLSGTNLSRANLHNAYLTNANLDRTNLLGASLSGTRGIPILTVTVARSQPVSSRAATPLILGIPTSSRSQPLVRSAPPQSRRQVPLLGEPATPIILPRQLPEASIPLPTPILNRPIPSSTPTIESQSPIPNLQIVLIGMIQLGDNSAALFEIDGNTKRVNVGELIGTSEWTLVSVKDGKIEVSGYGEVLSVYTGQTIPIPSRKPQSN